MEDLITTYEEADQEYELALADAKGDFPDVPEADVAHEMALAVAFRCDTPTKLEFLRVKLGLSPREIRELAL